MNSKNQTKTLFAVVLYMGFSSTMLIINKAAVKYFPLPSILLTLQMAVSAGLVWGLGQINYLKVDQLEWSKVKAYIGVVVAFILNLYTNIKAVQYSNVETVIVFQTLTSLAVAYGDFKVLKGAMPSMKILLSLCIIVVGSILYLIVESSQGMQAEAYFWVLAYFGAKTFDMLYTKHIVDTVPMSSWGRSFYNNIISVPPVLIMALMTREDVKYGLLVAENGFEQPTTFIMVVLSCVMGLGISISGFMAREQLSATSFSVVGNMNKILTVFINYVAWSHHSSIKGLFCLAICIFGGAYYARVRQEEEEEKKEKQIFTIINN